MNNIRSPQNMKDRAYTVNQPQKQAVYNTAAPNQQDRHYDTWDQQDDWSIPNQNHTYI